MKFLDLNLEKFPLLSKLEILQMNELLENYNLSTNPTSPILTQEDKYHIAELLEKELSVMRDLIWKKIQHGNDQSELENNSSYEIGIKD